ncbi:enterobactin exporter EntS [Terricaulis silvestris]|uniref:Enterobactin exporter EntS n=1 Tax=Terricaulis silvestris TaxID=2686094 RepID=A0A6I6MHI9_9CAUL|nr:enterobactin exporter EntS [Terricaulis silvestris]
MALSAYPRGLPALRVPSLGIFRHRQFAQFWVARWCATLAIQIQATAMGWQVYDAAREHGQSVAEAAFVLGLVGLAQFLPLLVLSLFGGQAADRYNRRLILTACILAKAVILLGLTSVANMGPDIVIPAVFAAAVTAGIINAFLPPAASALLPMLLPRDELPQGIAWSSLAFQSALIVGPAIGGLLYGLGAPVPYATAFVLLVIGAALLFLLRPPAQEPVKDARTIGMIMEGLRYVWGNKIVLGAISLDLVVVLLAGAVALLPVFARDILHAGPSELGILRSAMGVGAASVALFLAMKPLRQRVGAWMFGSTVVFGLATIVFGLSQNLWLTAGALAIAGGVDMISVYVRSSLIQLATPDAMRGRVSAVSFVFISASNEFGDFEAGLMARIFGPVLAVTIGGVGAVAASLGWIKLFPDLAKADGFEPSTLPPQAQNAVNLAREVEKS